MKTVLYSWENVSLSQLPQLVEDFMRQILPESVIFLTGELGAGKTSFIQKFSQKFEGKFLSPTYAILQESSFLLHADFYRIESADELIYLELDSHLQGKKYFFIEWGTVFYSHLQKLLPFNNYYELVIEGNGDERKYSLFHFFDGKKFPVTNQ